MDSPRLLSAMRTCGDIHFGHYFGALRHWCQIQYQYNCSFMLADVQSFGQTLELEHKVTEIAITWLSAGIDPSQSTIFIQSQIPEQFELYTILSAITPISWLERVVRYKDITKVLEHTDASTYGLLGDSLLYVTNMLLYQVNYVATAERKVGVIELARDVARRFNYLFGREEGFEEKALQSIKKLGVKKAALYKELLVQYQQYGNEEALSNARFMLEDVMYLSYKDRERLFAFVENKSRVIFTEPTEVTTESLLVLGNDGQVMSNHQQNAIYVYDKKDVITAKLRAMPTDPARMRITDKGNPDKCPVWQLHKCFSDATQQYMIESKCTTAAIGCVACKTYLSDAIIDKQTMLVEAARPYRDDHNLIKQILSEGKDRARESAVLTLAKVKQAISAI